MEFTRDSVEFRNYRQTYALRARTWTLLRFTRTSSLWAPARSTPCEVPPRGRRRQCQRHGQGVEHGASAGRGDSSNCRVGCCSGRREVDQPLDALVECLQLEAILRVKIGSELLHGPPELAEHGSRHGRADVEGHGDVNRQLLVADVSHFLKHAVVDISKSAAVRPVTARLFRLTEASTATASALARKVGG